jgi:hypothetical protein
MNAVGTYTKVLKQALAEREYSVAFVCLGRLESRLDILDRYRVERRDAQDRKALQL